jgi:hypothetical protein
MPKWNCPHRQTLPQLAVAKKEEENCVRTGKITRDKKKKKKTKLQVFHPTDVGPYAGLRLNGDG